MKKIITGISLFLKKLKKADYRHYILIGSLLLLISITAIVRPEIYIRLWLSLVTLFKTFINIFIPLDKAKPIDPPKLNDYKLLIAIDLKSLIYDFKITSLMLFNKDNAGFYGINLLNFLYNLLRVFIWIPLVIVLIMLINDVILKEKDADEDEESVALVKFKKIENKVISPVKKWFKELKNFIIKNKVYTIVFIIIISIIYRIIPLGIDLISVYFNLVKFFDFTILFNLLSLIIFDIFTITNYYNKFFLFLIMFIVVVMARNYFGRKKLTKMQERNEKAAEELAIATLVTGPVGSGKTMMVTSLAIDIEMQFRMKAFDIIKKYYHMFPEFPYYEYENWIIENFKNEIIVNRSQIKYKVNERIDEFIQTKDNSYLFGYDPVKYPIIYFNGIQTVSLKEALIEYGQAFYLYWIDKPLSFSNYSIRHQYDRSGHFPEYDYDYINMNKHNIKNNKQYSSISSFDSRRILTHANPYDSTKWYQMDGQVEIYTEIDKERGNRDDYIGLEKKSDSANQRNDGFNKSIKITRHEFTIDGEPFTRLLFDSQREYSVNADLRETCEDRIKIQKKGKTRIALPFSDFDYLICNPIINIFDDYYYRFRNKRNDKTVYNYILNKIIKLFYNHLTRVVNTFGYQTVNYRHEIGATAQERGVLTDKVYYFINQKMYANRYSTDCYSAFFDNEREKANSGFLQAKTYEGTKATIEELSAQDSYWIDELRTYTSLNEEQSKIEYKDEY